MAGRFGHLSLKLRANMVRTLKITEHLCLECLEEDLDFEIRKEFERECPNCGRIEIQAERELKRLCVAGRIGE